MFTSCTTSSTFRMLSPENIGKLDNKYRAGVLLLRSINQLLTADLDSKLTAACWVITISIDNSGDKEDNIKNVNQTIIIKVSKSIGAQALLLVGEDNGVGNREEWGQSEKIKMGNY